MAVTFRVFLIPRAKGGYRLRPLFVERPDSLDRDVQIAYSAEFGIQPFQFVSYFAADRVIDHRREKQDGGTQMGQRNAHMVQRARVAFDGCFLICTEILEMARCVAAESRIAGSRAIEL